MADTDNKPLTLTEISEATQKRLALISEEFRRGFEFINNYPRSVTFFGSSRALESDPSYQKALRLASRVVTELHYSVVTGGGPGIMEAANRGAFEAGGNSLGLTISLPKEQHDNKYLTDKEGFYYFFSRKVCLSFSAEAFLFFPGGFGTLDEFTEILTLVQTNKIPPVPLIMVGESFWQEPLEKIFRENLLKNHMIEEQDLSLYTITDDEDEILRMIKEAPVRFGVKYNHNGEKTNGSETSKKSHEPLSGLFKKINW